MQPHRLAFGIVLVVAFVDYVDVSIVNAVVPQVRDDLGATDSQVQWFGAAYALGFGTALVAGGRLGDVIGDRRSLCWGLGAFVVASATCAAAPTAGTLVAGRTAQGLAAAVMVPQVFALAQRLFAPEQRAAAFSAYAGVTAVASVVGAPLGGLLVLADPLGLGWRAVFCVNVPIGLATLAGVLVLVPRDDRARARGLDVVGAVLVGAGLLLLVLPMVQASTAGWNLPLLGCLPMGLLVLTAFALHLRRRARAGRARLVEPELFSTSSFVLGLVAVLALFSAVGSFFLLGFLYVQDVLGLTVLTSSLLLACWPLAIGVTSTALARRPGTDGARAVVVGSLLMAAGVALVAAAVLAAPDDLPAVAMLPGLLLAGAGMGAAAPRLLALPLRDVAAAHAGAASGVLTSGIQLGSAVGIGVAGSLYFTLVDHVGAGRGFGLTLGWHVAACLVVAVVARGATSRGRADTARPS